MSSPPELPDGLRLGRPAEPDSPATGAWRWLPGLHTLTHYRRSWLGPDLAAGLSLTAVLVPVSVAYAVAAGVPGVHGLYASLAALVVYALAGPSRVLVLGPDSSLSALILAAVLALSAGDPQRGVAVAALLAVVSGLVCLLAGVLRLGFITELLSKPIRLGYMNGIALTVVVGQAPALFGFHVEGRSLWEQGWQFAQGVLAGAFQPRALALGAATLAAILLLRRAPRVPGVLLVVMAATALVAAGGWDGVPVLGPLPSGLQGWAWPGLSPDELGRLALAGLAVALVAFADTSVLSRSFAARRGAPVDPNQELVALGAVNLAAGLVQGFPVSASASRTPVAEAAGARTQVAGLVAAACMAALLLLAPGLLHHLPLPVLAAVVIAAALGVFEVAELQRIRKVQPWEFWLAMACLVGVALLGVLQGIVLAVGLAVAEFLWAAWRPYSAVLGRLDGVKGYHDVRRHPEARQVPGLLLFRWDAPLFFANAEAFRAGVLAAVQSAPVAVRRLVVSAEPVTGVDVTSADMLVELDRALHEAGIELCFAEVKGPVKDKLMRFGLFAQLGSDRFFPTVGAAVTAYRQAHAVAWVDWEDRPPGPGPGQPPA